MAVSSWALAQTGSVTGRVTDPDSGDGLIGANVIIKGTTTGATTDIDGYYKIGGLPAGNVTFVISYIGFETVEKSTTITDGQVTDMGVISLSAGSIGLQEIEVIASVAVDRKTPVAVSTVKLVPSKLKASRSWLVR